MNVDYYSWFKNLEGLKGRRHGNGKFRCGDGMGPSSCLAVAAAEGGGPRGAPLAAAAAFRASPPSGEPRPPEQTVTLRLGAPSWRKSSHASLGPKAKLPEFRVGQAVQGGKVGSVARGSWWTEWRLGKRASGGEKCPPTVTGTRGQDLPPHGGLPPARGERRRAAGGGRAASGGPFPGLAAGRPSLGGLSHSHGDRGRGPGERVGGPRRLASGLLSRGDSGVSCPVAASPRSRKATAAAAAAGSTSIPRMHRAESGCLSPGEEESAGRGARGRSRSVRAR